MTSGAIAAADPPPASPRNRPERKELHREAIALHGLYGHIESLLKANPQMTIEAIWHRLADNRGFTVAYHTHRLISPATGLDHIQASQHFRVPDL